MKYPRTFHLPWSPGGTNDDKRIKSVSHFLNEKVVITEKMDGSNVCFSSQNFFARSHSGPPKHKSFDYAKALHSSIKNKIPNYNLLFGEWCFAVHDIHYDFLPNYFLLFGVLLEQEWQEWGYVKQIANHLNLSIVPELFVGEFNSEGDLKNTIEDLATGNSLFGSDTKEGVVIRKFNCFNDFSTSVAKWVRANHPRDKDNHWMYKKILKQKLK